MWHKWRKALAIISLVIVNTILVWLLIGDSYRHDYGVNEQNVSYKKSKTFDIYTVEDYLEFANSVNNDFFYEHWEIALCNDLDFSGYTDVPVIGETSLEEDAITFMGTFEGNGYKISNLHISNPGGRAGMFAKLGGIVKNLRLEDSSFNGRICGGISAESYKANILNCYVDAQVQGEIAGTITGELWGTIYNSVYSDEPIGKISYGDIKECFQTGTQNIEVLNQNLCDLSGRYQDSSFNHWERTENGILSKEKAELLETLTARLMTAGKEFIFQGFYSSNDGYWYIALPATYGNAKLYLDAKTSNGSTQSFIREFGQEEFLFTWGEYRYPIRFIASDYIDSICITLEKNKALEYVHENKEERISGYLTVLHSDGTVSNKYFKGFYGHGNDSWKEDKKSYNLKFDSYVELLGMNANDDFALMAGYRWNSLMSYVANEELTKMMGFDYPLEYRLVNLYVGGEYLGVYYLTGKLELDTNRIEINSVYESTEKLNSNALRKPEYQVWYDEKTQEKRYYYDIAINPDDITGGYLLELDRADYGPADSRFTTKDKTNKVVLKRAQYSSKEQVDYIAEFWQGFEDALYSENGYNTLGKHYTEYIDVESFAMQWLMYELSMEDSLFSSVYYYKESDVNGDGLLHACYPWDLERSFVNFGEIERFGNIGVERKYWAAFYEHEDFREVLAQVWFEKFIPSIEYMVAEIPMENDMGVRNLRWHLSNLKTIGFMEKIRWNTMDMELKCEMIREFMLIRKEVISTALENELNMI